MTNFFTAQAGTQASVKPLPRLTGTPPANPSIPASGVLWDNWYIETEKNEPYSYYNEKVEVQGDRIKIKNNRWIKVGSHIKVENLGASAKNTPYLEPLLYNFHTEDVGTDKTIDGTILENGKIFSVKIKHGKDEAKPLRAEMLPRLILSSFFPVWIVKNNKRITGVQPIDFQAIVEDQVEEEIPVVKGNAYEMMPDDFSKKTETRKIRIVFANLVNYWYINKAGETIRIQIPAMEHDVVKTDQKTAESFLLPKPPATPHSP